MRPATRSRSSIRSRGSRFPANVIPSSRISPQAASLLGYYPRPNLLTGGGFNFQAPLITAARQDLITTRVTQPINNRNQLIGLFAYQRTHTDQTTLFGFEDANVVSGVDTSVTWTRRINQFFSIRPRVQFTQITTNATPYFANRTNVSGDAGITGNNQDPANWGPPSLTFSSISGLTDALPNYNRNQTLGGGGEAYFSRGRHNFTFGGDVRRNHVDILTQQNPRGGFAFTGKLTGSDLADFMLGIPSTSSIAFGNADKYLRAFSSDAYITDDMRLSPTFTVQAGARWEYETPPTELYGRLVNLDVAPGFSAISPVVAGGTGSLTGQQYPAAPDQRRSRRAPAARRDRVAARSRIVAGDPRRLRDLPQHVLLPADHTAPGAAAAALHGVHDQQQPRAPADAGERVHAADLDHREHVRGRSEPARRRVAELAGAHAARPAGIADDDRDVSRHEGHEPAAGVSAEHVSCRKRRTRVRRVLRASST